AEIEEDDGWDDVLALAEHLNADVYQEPIPARWTFPRGHRLFRGGLLPAQKPLAEQLAEHDVVVVLGARVFLYYAHVPGDPIKKGTKLFQITSSPLDAAAALVGSSMVGNVADAARYIRAHVQGRSSRTESSTKPPAPGREEGPSAEHPISTAYL